jgi:hypothetical protein
MHNDDLVFKEYKASIPPQWTAFDTAPKKKLQKSFIAFLRTPAGALATDSVAVTGDDDEDDASSSAVKKKKNWMEEMTAYVKAQEIKRASKVKSLELEAELRRRKKLASDRQEQSLAVTANGALNEKLVLTAVEVATALQRRKNAERQAAIDAKRAEELAKHTALLEERNKQVATNREEKSQFIAETITFSLQKSEKNREKQATEEQKKLLAQHNKEMQRAEESAKRLAQAHEKERQEQLEANRMADTRVADALDKQRTKTSKFEETLNEKQQRTALRLAAAAHEREHRVASNATAVKYERGMQRRSEMRQQQLQSCAEAEKQRTRRLEEVLRQRDEAVAELGERSASRMSRAERNIENISARRLKSGQELLDRTRTPNVNVTNTSGSVSVNESQVAKSVWEHRERRREIEENKLMEAMQRESLGFQRDEKVRAFERLQQSRRFSASVEHDRKLAEHTERAATIRAAASDATLAAHFDKEARSKKHFEAMQGEVKESLTEAAEAQAAKILAALELTRVKQHEELMKSVEAKQKKLEEKEARAAAQHALKMHQKQEEQRINDERKRRLIEEANSEREERLTAILHEKALRVEAAVKSRQDQVYSTQEKLARQSKETSARLAAEAAARSAELDRKRKALAAKEEARCRSIAQARESQQEMLQEMAMSRDEQIAQAQTRAVSQQEMRTKATVEKLVHVYEIGKDRVKHISFTPIRARTASPS